MKNKGLEKIVVRDKSYQGRGFVIGESGSPHTIAENLMKQEAYFIADSMNKNIECSKDVPKRIYENGY